MDKSGSNGGGSDGLGAKFSGDCAELTEKILKCFYDVYNELGFGFVEQVYQESLRLALLAMGLAVEAEVGLPVYFRGSLVGVFKADLIVEKTVILELKVAERILATHEGQLLHYLRSTQIEIGMILNFGEKPTVRRMQMSNDRKRSLPTRA